jgi:hypothetical protein
MMRCHQAQDIRTSYWLNSFGRKGTSESILPICFGFLGYSHSV